MKENIMLDLPFYKNDNDGNQCSIIGIKIATEYFLGKSPSLEEIDKLVDRKNGQWTWNSQVVLGLYKLGLKVKYYTDTEQGPFIEKGADYIKEKFPKNSELLLSKINLNTVIKSTKLIVEKGLFKKKRITLKEIKEHIKQNHIVLMPVDWNIIKKINGPYKGHIIILTGFDKENFYFHNSGPTNPEKNQKLSQEIIMAAWNAPEIEHDITVVFGKKD